MKSSSYSSETITIPLRYHYVLSRIPPPHPFLLLQYYCVYRRRPLSPLLTVAEHAVSAVFIHAVEQRLESLKEVAVALQLFVRKVLPR